MKKIILIFLFYVCMFSTSFSQVVNQGASINIKQKDDSILNNLISKESVRLLTIGIESFKDAEYAPLHSVSNLERYKIISENYLRLSYHNHPAPIFLNGLSVRANDVREAFSNIADKSTESDVIIISILSHGDVKNGEYYLICSDTESTDYASTAVSGSEIRSYLEKMANKGAIVLIFIDTCHAAALFEKISFSPRSNGAIAYYASSKSYEEAKEINQFCRFTDAILNVFQNKNKDAFNENGYVTIKSLEAQIIAALSAITIQNQQHPVFAYFSNNDHFEDYPIIKEKEFVKYGSLWQNPSPFSPFKVSPNKGKRLDYALICVEGVSFVGMIICGPILQSYYKNKISKETNFFKRNDLKRKGKNASIGFCVSSGLLISSYLARTLHVHHQLSLENKERQFASLDISPVISTDYNGLAFVLNF